MAKKKPHMERSDIPYVERLRRNKLAGIAAHRDDAHLIELKLSLISLNETEGLGCVRLSRYAKRQQENREKYYADPEFESVKLDQAVRQLAICKILIGGEDFDHLAEEIADATITLEQMRLMFNINDRVCEYMDVKVKRLDDNLRLRRGE